MSIKRAENLLKPTPRSSHRARPVTVPSHLYPYVEQTLDDAAELIKQRIQAKRTLNDLRLPTDPVEWAESRFYIPSTGEPIRFFPHQRAFTRLALTRDAEGYFPYRTIIYSTIKQSGKSTWAAVVLRWYAETQRRRQELYAIGNDQDQAKTRSFREIRWSLEETPGYNANREILPGQWSVQKTMMRCLLTGTEIRALAVDAKGEAGGKPAIQVWTELWGFEHEDALRFWDELTPIPTIPDSFRIIETYAGYDGESTLLQQQYDLGMAGHQLTEGELRERTGIEGSFAESPNPEDLVPIWENKAASLLMYWDSGPNARRMPWQQGTRGEQYYQEQSNSLLPNAFRRLHYNEWTSSTSGFVPAESWDACKEALPDLEPGDRTPVVLGVDAAVTGDCFAVVAVTRHPERHDEVAVRRVKIWRPKDNGGIIDYAEPELFIRRLCGGYCNGSEMHARTAPGASCDACKRGDWVPGLNVVHVAYDAYQMVDMMQRLEKDRVAWVEAFGQGGDRSKADKQLYDLIINRRIAHDGNPDLRAHVVGAGAKASREDSTLRLVKISPARKIDAAVATSMATYRCLWLVL